MTQHGPNEAKTARTLVDEDVGSTRQRNEAEATAEQRKGGAWMGGREYCTALHMIPVNCFFQVLRAAMMVILHHGTTPVISHACAYSHLTPIHTQLYSKAWSRCGRTLRRGVGGEERAEEKKKKEEECPFFLIWVHTSTLPPRNTTVHTRKHRVHMHL